MVSQVQWKDWKNGSGKHLNPGKTIFLKIGSDAVRDVGKLRDSDGVFNTRKEMIRCCMVLKFNGRWKVNQLFPHLQEIVRKYIDNSNGVYFTDSLALDGDVTESDSN